MKTGEQIWTPSAPERLRTACEIHLILIIIEKQHEFLQFAFSLAHMWKSWHHLNASGMSLMWVYIPAGLPNADTIVAICYPPSAACQSNSWDEQTPEPHADQ